MANVKLTPLEYCRNHQVKSENVPAFLQQLPTWVIWKAFNAKPDGRFDKIPIDPVTGRKVNGQDPTNHISFDQALQAYQRGAGNGVGIVLTGTPVSENTQGEPLYLVGLDLDKVQTSEEKTTQAKTICRSIGSYYEVSPSGKGIRIFALSREPLGKGQGLGGEMYHKGRFLTVTGHGSKREIVEATESLKELHRQWWPPKFITDGNVVHLDRASTQRSALNDILSNQSWPETDTTIAQLSGLLASIPADTDHDTWRDVIWSVASLDWECGKQLLIDWSSGDRERWSTKEGVSEAVKYLTQLYDAYDPYKGITVGTLFYQAERFGRPKGEDQKELTFKHDNHLKGKRFNILSRDDLKSMPPANWLVHGILPATGLATIYGQSGSGKSFIAIDLAIAITNGHANWFNRRLTKKSALYIALEGGFGIKKRIDAWEISNQKKALNLKYLLDSFSLLDAAHVAGLITKIKRVIGNGCVVFLDTLSQATSGADENSSVDMGRILAASQEIARQTEGMVILIHHTGKDARKGARGHSSFHAAMDAVIEVCKKDQSRFWKTAKVKDGDDNIKEAFNLEIVNVGTDQYGLPETSCVVSPWSVIFSAVKPKGKNQNLALQAITDALASKENLSGGEAEQLVKENLIEVDTGHRAVRAKEAINSLAASGFINISGGSIILPKTTGS